MFCNTFLKSREVDWNKSNESILLRMLRIADAVDEVPLHDSGLWVEMSVWIPIGEVDGWRAGKKKTMKIIIENDGDSLFFVFLFLSPT